ncbi:hypothetical protein A6A25_31030 [Saccharothrix sp. CB00851]|nr:hypothetical protein A6A25_31030 [Saccharothrix sp. CB00851]
MCRSCAQSPMWTRPSTSLRAFLDALTGAGLLRQLSSFTPGYLDDELDGYEVQRATELLRLGEWPDDDDDTAAWEAYEAAHFVRDKLLLP